MAAGSIRILPQSSYSRCFCPHTCLHQDRRALCWGPPEPDTRSTSAESEDRKRTGEETREEKTRDERRGKRSRVRSEVWVSLIKITKILNSCQTPISLVSLFLSGCEKIPLEKKKNKDNKKRFSCSENIPTDNRISTLNHPVLCCKVHVPLIQV